MYYHFARNEQHTNYPPPLKRALLTLTPYERLVFDRSREVHLATPPKPSYNRLQESMSTHTGIYPMIPRCRGLENTSHHSEEQPLMKQKLHQAFLPSPSQLGRFNNSLLSLATYDLREEDHHSGFGGKQSHKRMDEIRRDCPYLDTVNRQMAINPAQYLNNSAFRSMLEREKLSGSNFNDWYRHLRIVLRDENKMDVIEKQMPHAPAETATAAEHATYNVAYVRYNEVACLMLGSMSPELQRQFENYNPHDMINELRSMFGKPAGVELFDLIQSLYACKHEAGTLVSSYVLKMKSYLDQLKRLSYVYPQPIAVCMILNSLSKDFEGFVHNYNMHSMGKTIDELHAMLIEYEKSLPIKSATSPFLMIRGGKIQKVNKKSQAKGKPKGNGKGKQIAYVPKLKQTPQAKKEHPAKNEACHHCNEVGHWRRNCPAYLAEIMKKKKQQAGSTGTSGT